MDAVDIVGLRLFGRSLKQQAAVISQDLKGYPGADPAHTMENGRVTPDSNSKKYDRQLRTWGAHGQALLESAKICLLRCGPTGSETLKNLVLGGIAAFTGVDDARV